MFKQQIDHGIARYRDMLRQAERRHTGVSESWHPFNAWEVLQQTAGRVVRSFDRRVVPCLKLQPACEIRFG
jgi:hypothetical protein